MLNDTIESFTHSSFLARDNLEDKTRQNKKPVIFLEMKCTFSNIQYLGVLFI